MSMVFRNARAKINNALVAELALPWLEEFGPKGPVDSETLSVAVNQNQASACAGAKEAKVYLQSAALEFMGSINTRAIEMARADMQKAIDAIVGDHDQ